MSQGVGAASVGARFFWRTGLMRAMRSTGLVRFLWHARGMRSGPHLVFALHAANTPHKEALIFEDRRLTYSELYRRIDLLARGLRGAGVNPRDTVGIMLGNCSEFIEAQSAVAAMGATAVSIGYRLKAPEVAYILGNAGCRALIFGVEFRDAAVSAAREVGTPLVIPVGGEEPGARGYEEVLESGTQVPTKTHASDATGALMIYTSGTTGKPKGAQRELASAGLDVVASHALLFPLSHDDRHLAVCPLYHSAAPAYIALTFAIGGTVVLTRHFDPEDALRLIERERITSSTMVPTMLHRMVTLPDEVRRRYDTSSLRWLMACAAPLPTDLARSVEAWLGPVLYNMYGATETGFVSVARPGEHAARPGTVGRVIPRVDVRLLDESGRDVTKMGQVGEIFVRSSMLMAGYHRDDDATRKASREGYISVGDLGRIDSEGYLYIVDRKVDMVISGGVNIYPLEIEARLREHPDVSDCAVVGVADSDWGERLEAFVVLCPGAKADERTLDEHCRKALADFKRPRRFHFVDALPRTETGKVLKRQLREASRESTAEERRLGS